MNVNKLREVIAEMEAERKLLDESIESVRLVVARMEGQLAAPSGIEISAGTPRSYIDDAVELFQAVGKPMHVRDIAERIAQKRSESVTRGSLESTFSRHIKKAARRRIAKFGPSVFGLTEWKRSQSTQSVQHEAASSQRTHEARGETIPERLTAFFETRPEQILKATDLSRELGIVRHTIYTRLRELCQKGVIEKVEMGAYRLRGGDIMQMPVAV